jgi:hypothetical protein
MYSRWLFGALQTVNDPSKLGPFVPFGDDDPVPESLLAVSVRSVGELLSATLFLESC